MKKKAAGKAPKRPKPKIKEEHKIEIVERGSFAGGSAVVGSKPTKRKRIKKDALRGRSERAGIEEENFVDSAVSESFEEPGETLVDRVVSGSFEEAEETLVDRVVSESFEEIELDRELEGYVWDRDEVGSARPPSLARTIECTPQMKIQTELIQKKAYRMSVFVNRGPTAEGSEVEPVRVEVPQDLLEFPLDVWLDCSSHFDVEDVSDPPIVKVNTETATSDELGFTLKVLTNTDKSPMYVSAFFRYNGRPSGKITRFLEWAEDTLQWKKFAVAEESEEETVLPNVDAEPSVVVETKGIPADIRVEVLRAKVNNGKDFTLKCYTPVGKWEGDWNLPMVSKDLVSTYMKNFMADKGEARIASLEGAGMDFWDALPGDEVRELLLLALEMGAQTISIISEEPYIPWELIVPYRDVQNPRKPLGIEMQMGRWITGNYRAAPQRISLKSSYIICPKTSGLTCAAQEVTFLTQQLLPQFNPVDEVVPTSFSGVNKALGAGPRSVIHFICHGKSASLQTLQLDSPDTLNCSQVRALDGFRTAFKNGPLAFLNACEVGGQVLALDGVGGFANSFIQLGASAVVAPLWAVQDKVALDVTQTFYPEALKGVPFASVMKGIRAKAYSQAIDSYAAYCFYGDPIASLA